MSDDLNKDFFRKIVNNKRISDLMGVSIDPDDLLFSKATANRFETDPTLEYELITNIYLRSSYYKEAKKIFLYKSLPNEMDTSFILKACFKDGKKVYMPKVLDHNPAIRRMEFIQVFPDTVYESNNGILEPVGFEFYSPKALEDVIEVITPGVCFDRKGNRLGYGGSYYDRYISRIGKENFHLTALAFDYQLFETLPTTSFDVPVDLIITNKNYIDLVK